MNRRRFLQTGGACLAGLALAPKRVFGSASGAAPWKFGVMADTQWRTGANSGGELASCALHIISALNEQFIQHGVQFAIQVGDLVDVENISGFGRTLPTRANAANPLYTAGIGFFPVRGNHEGSATAAAEIPMLFPQTLGAGPHVFGATDFSSPVLSSTSTDPLGNRLRGLSYSYRYNNVRCILIDQFTRADGTGSTNSNALDQLDWVDSMLAAKPSGGHTFVFSHKNLHGQNHKDVLFGSSLTSNAEHRDRLISSMRSAGAEFHISGHDHMHHRANLSTRDGSANITQLIASSNSYKFYVPRSPFESWETPVAQELFTIGYYIFTVDGPWVTVDFYSSSHGSDYGDVDLAAPPSSLQFYLRETFGYSLNGKRFLVASGQPYSAVQDAYAGTAARMLGGVNSNSGIVATGRRTAKTITTGWKDAMPGLASNILRVWGMADNLVLNDGGLTGLLPDSAKSQASDLFALSLSYDARSFRPTQLMSGKLFLACRDNGGNWVNAADLNLGGVKTFKYGPWRPAYGLGTYGADPSTSTVWAVLNHDGEFAVKMQ